MDIEKSAKRGKARGLPKPLKLSIKVTEEVASWYLGQE